MDDELFSVTGMTALVTGASSGLGRHLAEMLARRGANVVAVARRSGDFFQLAEPQTIGAGRLLRLECDVTREQDVLRVFDEAERTFGPVTVTVNNAGAGHFGRAADLAMDEWRHLMAVNLDAAFFVAREAARRMVASALPGSIVNISSILARDPQNGAAAYSVSKAALDQMTRSLALEWGRHGVRVNAIAPGWFPTPMTQKQLDLGLGAILKRKNPMRRLGEATDLDGVLLLLASAAGRYINGAIIPVDGGQSLSG